MLYSITQCYIQLHTSHCCIRVLLKRGNDGCEYRFYVPFSRYNHIDSLRDVFSSSGNSISCLSQMGMSQSIYEKHGTLDYYRFSAEEYALVKKVWSGIEINPQFHGNACLKR